MLKLTSPIPISVNHYMQARVTYVKGRPMATMYETSEAKKYKKWFAKYVVEEAIKQNWTMIPNRTQHYYVGCKFYFDRKRKDANNYFKLLLDAISEAKIIWLDDDVVCERVEGIWYDYDNPRIEIEIYPVDYVGIFPSQAHLDEFKKRCLFCRWHKKGRCSVLVDAISGVVKEEIRNNKCMKYKELKCRKKSK